MILRIGRNYERFIILWGPVIIYCTAIFIQSSYPSVKTGVDIPGFDKIMHLCGYGLLSGTMLRAVRGSFPQMGVIRQLILSIVLSILYGISDEIHQSFVSYRTADFFDCIADAAGSVMGVTAFQLISKPGNS